jgi:hypothetical protein
LEIYEKEPPIHFRDHLAYEIPVPYVKFFISRERMNDDTPGSEDPRAETAVQMKRRRLKKEERESREPLPITEVSIGPVLRRDESRLACEILLREKGYEDVPVNVPDIPYRGV